MPGTIQLFNLNGNLEREHQVNAELVRIGRSPECDVVLSLDGRIAPHHATLQFSDGTIQLTDHGSPLGTRLNGERVRPQVLVSVDAGSPITIGIYTLRVTAAQPTAPPSGPEPQEAARAQPSQPPPEPPPATPPPPPAPPPPPSPPPKRRTAAVVLPDRLESRYLQFLPSLYQGQDFLGRFLLIFEAVWEPLEQRQDHISRYFDPATAPASFLPWFASWFDLIVEAELDEPQLRLLAGSAAELVRWRGTTYGLSRLIEIVVGVTPVISPHPEQPFCFQVVLYQPAGQSPLPEALIKQLIERHKPAHAGYTLDILGPV